MSSNLSLYFVNTAFDFIREILYFPLWWYSRGLLRVYKAVLRSINNEAKNLALKIWMANLFTPMYGQYDWQGRIISFVLRIVILIGRLAVLIIWIIINLILFLIYILLPLIIVWQIIYVLF